MRTWTTHSGHKIIRILYGGSNVFLLLNNGNSILIDTSFEFMWRLLEKRLNKLGIKHIDLLVLTHSHFDHAANAAKIRKRYKSQIIIHQSETGFLMNGDSIPPVGSNRVINFLINAFVLLPGTTAIYEPCYFDYTFIDRFDLSKFGFNAYLMHTPGHTKGSISIIIDNEFAIVGDTMFAIFPRTAFPLIAFDKMQLLNSWEQLLNTGCEIFIPSHGSVVKRALFENEFKKRTISIKNNQKIT